MNIKRIIIVCSILSVSLIFSQTISSSNLNVLTYNIHHGVGVDGKLDLKRIADFIVQNEIDIAALQEVDSSTARINGLDAVKYLSDQTKLNYVFGGNINFDGGRYGNLVLSKYEILKSENVLLQNLNGGEQRGLLITHLKVGTDTLIFANAHFDHREDDFERMLSAEVLINKFSEINKSIILSGDFNDIPGSTSINIIKTEFEDAEIDLNGINMATYPADNPSKCIDYIFYKNRRSAFKLSPLKSKVDLVNYSDHLPKIVIFKFGN